jgi:hypothetical protein
MKRAGQPSGWVSILDDGTASPVITGPYRQADDSGWAGGARWSGRRASQPPRRAATSAGSMTKPPDLQAGA